MRIEICIAKEKMTKMPTGAVDALKEELTRRISMILPSNSGHAAK
ncbi:DNA-damage-inducible protein DinI [Escherichia coli]|nr:DNA-damage-inducible protein DinI [Escherichia coli]EEV8603935.1 DNA-damage-inducible protein DinI [Escherichia coli]